MRNVCVKKLRDIYWNGLVGREKSETPEPEANPQDDTNAPKRPFAKSTAPEIPNMFVTPLSEKKDIDSKGEKKSYNRPVI